MLWLVTHVDSFILEWNHGNENLLLLPKKNFSQSSIKGIQLVVTHFLLIIFIDLLINDSL